LGFGQAAAEGGKGTIVAGAVGPTGEGAGFIDDEKGAEIAAAFRTQIHALVKAHSGRCTHPPCWCRSRTRAEGLTNGE
jgi:hypothetical protein